MVQMIWKLYTQMFYKYIHEEFVKSHGNFLSYINEKQCILTKIVSEY